jgi:alkanesulfonate monooxygenase SsuD/methylene tetrahydromethanopterin reductase-like flavin-dependent oxidoreductase (luciferase family)
MTVIGPVADWRDMTERGVLFGVGLGDWSGANLAETNEVVRTVEQADRAGLDLFTMADHPYLANRVDASMGLAFLLGRTSRIRGAVTVTNLPSRPAPVLAHSVTSLSALSEGRVILGIGSGGLWDAIVKLGVRRLTPGEAVAAMEEAIQLVRLLSGGGDPVTFTGRFYAVSELEPSPLPTPPIWTGSVGPRSLAVTGRLADGWVPSQGADWLSPRYRASRPIVDEAAAAAGRDPHDVVSIFNFGGRITPAAETATRDADGRWLGGSVAQWAEELSGAVLEHGAGGFVYREPGMRPSETALRRWAEEVVPAVRQQVAGG